MRKTLFIAILALICFNVDAKLSVRQPCSDGMVLQQQTSAVVWGWADPGAAVTVTPSWNGKSSQARADAGGLWKAYVSTPAASYKSYSIKVKSGAESFTIKDVLVGEVWLASGQSNMEMPIRGFFNCPVEGAAEVISSAPMRDQIRMFTAKIEQPEEPADEVKTVSGWQRADPDNVSEMSAAAYFFARKLNQVLDIPIGIVSFPRGGSSVESWLPKKTLQAYGDDLSPEYLKAHYVDWSMPYQMYNGMEYPLRGYTAKGFIWYQGCTNVGKEDTFVERMIELVRQWRADWNDKDCQMPFYMVEIAPFRYGGTQTGKAPALRQAQHIVASFVDNAAIVVTNDLVYSYEDTNIHPSRKEPVGNRLAYLALNRDYGFSKIACYSPEAKRAFHPEGNSSEVWVELSSCPNGLNRAHEIEALEVCGSDGIFFPVTNASFDQGLLKLRSERIESPVGVRYGWGDFLPGNLKNAEGLPVAPFNLVIR